MQSHIYELKEFPRNLDFPFPLNEVGWMVHHRNPVQTLYNPFVCISFNRQKYNQDAPSEATFSVHYPGAVLNMPGFLHDEIFFAYSREYSEKLSELFRKVTYYRKPFIFTSEIASLSSALHERLERLHEPGMADNLDLLAIQIINSCIQAVNNYTVPVKSGDMRIYEIATRLKRGECLDMLIRKYNFSRRAFYYAWNRVFNISPNKFRQDEMLKQVVLLLQQSTMSISEIAYNCGFDNETCLYRQFKQKYHATPTQYRRQKQNSNLPNP